MTWFFVASIVILVASVIGIAIRLSDSLREQRCQQALIGRQIEKGNEFRTELVTVAVAVRRLEQRDEEVRKYLRELHAWIKARWSEYDVASLEPKAQECESVNHAR